MTRSEAGRLGGIGSRHINKRKHEECLRLYSESPRKCKQCGASLPYEKRYSTFCDHSCAACFNNKGVRRHGLPPTICKSCNKPTNSTRATYCSISCQHTHSSTAKLQKWLAGELSGGVGQYGEATANYIKRFIKERANHTCEICGTAIWMGRPIPLVVDHIDGNSTNNRPENLRAVCGNCDMQLPTYKSKNKGKGRAYRRERCKQGLSY